MLMETQNSVFCAKLRFEGSVQNYDLKENLLSKSEYPS